MKLGRVGRNSACRTEQLHFQLQGPWWRPALAMRQGESKHPDREGLLENRRNRPIIAALNYVSRGPPTVFSAPAPHGRLTPTATSTAASPPYQYRLSDPFVSMSTRSNQSPHIKCYFPPPSQQSTLPPYRSAHSPITPDDYLTPRPPRKPGSENETKAPRAARSKCPPPPDAA